MVEQGTPSAGANRGISFIIATRNRAHAIQPCLDSVAAAIAKAAPLDAWIVLADNGSTDRTFEIASAWARNSGVKIKLLREPRPGKSVALNRALRSARGDIFAFTDDDCRLHPDHINDLLSHDAADKDIVLRGGRIELGDPTDLPYTINTTPTLMRWSRAQNSARHSPMGGLINGCNMVARRQLFERIGLFDENFGPGTRMGSGDDTELIFRAYTDGIPLEYVPNMAVYHFHGRKTVDAGHRLWRAYALGCGGIWAKYLFKHPNLCRPCWWDLKNAVREAVTGSNFFLPNAEFSYRHKVAYTALGAMRYVFMRKHGAPPMLDFDERKPHLQY